MSWPKGPGRDLTKVKKSKNWTSHHRTETLSLLRSTTTVTRPYKSEKLSDTEMSSQKNTRLGACFALALSRGN